ncbi:hypothetical protein COY52_07570, partial [Candidatus Desantisbacteria bacterium CG_4_10_14_0_8_um_filter_48_22]
MKNKWSNYFWFSLACLAWFILRVGVKPSRIVYPCQRVAAAQSGWFITVFIIPIFISLWKQIKKIFFSRHFWTAVFACLAVLAVVFGLRFRGRPGSVYAGSAGSAGQTIPAMDHTRSSLPASAFTEVSFRYEPSAYYGETPPYDENDNPVYGLVWQAVEDLGLGTHSNPLDALVNPGDTVLIKVNLMACTAVTYTHPAVVRPVVDMCIAAGASAVLVGDGSQGCTGCDSAYDIMGKTGYETMMQVLQVRNPGIILRTIGLGDLNHWRWIYMGSYSSFAGSGYSNLDLPNYNNPYFFETDCYGVNPKGQAMAWYAVSDHELAVPVIINVAKMKCHQGMINTLCIKNHVGSTMPSTTNWTGFTNARLPHTKAGASGNEIYFGNDIFWRSIADMNKIVLYADRDGILRTSRQRRYFNVVDAVQASEYDNFAWPGKTCWRQCVLAGEDPAAVDAVGSRVMCYDWKLIPVIHKSAGEQVLYIGTDDASKIMVKGDDISQMTHIFEHCTDWGAYSAGLNITDYTPPGISMSTVIRDNSGVRIRASSGGVKAAFAFYRAEGTWSVKKMEVSGDWIWATLPSQTTEYWVQAQDEYFNFSRSGCQYCRSISNVIVYPVPYNPATGNMTFGFLTDNATINIYSIAGEFVRRLDKTGTGETKEWDGRNAEEEIVAGGVYIYSITNPAGEKKTGKFMVI